MNPIILTILGTSFFFAIIILFLAPKLVKGENAEQIAKGKATKSRDEIRRQIKIIRLAMAALIFVLVAIGAILAIIL